METFLVRSDMREANPLETFLVEWKLVTGGDPEKVLPPLKPS